MKEITLLILITTTLALVSCGKQGTGSSIAPPNFTSAPTNANSKVIGDGATLDELKLDEEKAE